jgi:hypothetical protein
VSDQSQAEARGMSPSAVAPDKKGKEFSGLLLILFWEQELSRADLLPQEAVALKTAGSPMSW